MSKQEIRDEGRKTKVIANERDVFADYSARCGKRRMMQDVEKAT